MAEDAYLKVAASQVQQAITAAQQEAHRIRGEADSMRRQLERDLTNMEVELQSKRAQFAGPTSGNPGRVEVVDAEIHRIRGRISDKQKEIERQMQQYEQQARAKEGVAGDLQSRVSDLERMANDPRLR